MRRNVFVSKGGYPMLDLGVADVLLECLRNKVMAWLTPLCVCLYLTSNQLTALLLEL